jgi:hypothetical protein
LFLDGQKIGWENNEPAAATALMKRKTKEK